MSHVQQILLIPLCDPWIVPSCSQTQARCTSDIIPPPLLTCKRRAQITPSSLLEDAHDSKPSQP